MKCPICGKKELRLDTRDMPYTYKGQTTVIKATAGEYCDACDEVIFDMSEANRMSNAMLAFNKEVNTHAAKNT
jgi:HTH-type transcriptional regulator / antitoxin MqsA